jgi:hypothetical protein
MRMYILLFGQLILAIRYPQVFLAIRKYFSPSASIFRYPQVFLAIRKYFPLSSSNSRHPQRN